MGLFNNQGNYQQLSPEQQRYKGARYNFFLLIGFTLINMLLLISNSGYYLLFSMSIPYFLTDLGLLLKEETGESIFMIIFIALSIFIVLLYVLCFVLSKKKPVWILVAAILFSLDTLFLLYFAITAFDSSVLIDLAFHAYVLFNLFSGYKYGKILKQIQDNPPPEVNPTENLTPFNEQNDTQTELAKDDVAPQQETVVNENAAETENKDDTKDKDYTK